MASLSSSQSNPQPQQTPVSYGDKLYWNNRYSTHKDTFDWYIQWPDFRQTVIDIIGPAQTQRVPSPIPSSPSPTPISVDEDESEKPAALARSVLVLGCGASAMPQGLADEGYRVVAIDWSDKVIFRLTKQQSLLSTTKRIEYIMADCTNMPEIRGQFDAIIDKGEWEIATLRPCSPVAGVLDATMCGDDGVAKAAALVAECARLLAPGGHYLLMTTTTLGRAPLLDKHNKKWNVVTEQIDGKWLYIAKAKDQS